MIQLLVCFSVFNGGAVSREDRKCMVAKMLSKLVNYEPARVDNILATDKPDCWDQASTKEENHTYLWMDNYLATGDPIQQRRKRRARASLSRLPWNGYILNPVLHSNTAWPHNMSYRFIVSGGDELLLYVYLIYQWLRVWRQRTKRKSDDGWIKYCPGWSTTSRPWVDNSLATVKPGQKPSRIKEENYTNFGWITF